MSCTLSAGRVHSLGTTEPFLVIDMSQTGWWQGWRLFILSTPKYLILSITHVCSHALKQVTQFPISMWHWTGLEVKWPTYVQWSGSKKSICFIYILFICKPFIYVYTQGTTGSKWFSAVTMSFFLVCMGFLVQVVRTYQWRPQHLPRGGAKPNRGTKGGMVY